MRANFINSRRGVARAGELGIIPGLMGAKSFIVRGKGNPEHVTAVFAGFGEKSVCAESVARSVVGHARRYIASGAADDEYLADQLMVPCALAGGGTFTTDEVPQHASTNAGITERFLPVRFSFRFPPNGAQSPCAVTPVCPA